MSRLEELIQQYCPDGVEYKKLGELGVFYGGLSGKTKEDFKDGNAKFISYKNVFYNLSLNIDTDERVKIGEGEKQNTIQYGDILFTGSSETPDECGMSSVLTHKTDEKLYLNSFCFGFRLHNPSQFCPDFLKHLFRSSELRKQIGKTASGTTRFNVSKKRFAEVEIPVPPFPVQEEIVRILDTFTELQAELQAELQKRKQQYNYYRDRLLSDTSFQKCKIIDLLIQPITDGPHTTPRFFETGIPFVSVDSVWDGQIHFEKKRGYISPDFDLECSKKYKPKRHDVFMVKSGSTTGKVAYVNTDESFNIWSPLAAMRVNEKTSPRFLFHLLQTSQVQEQVKSRSSQGSQPNLSMRVLEQFDVSVPSLKRQIEIATILDRFDTLTNNLSQGLPAEIEARRKQYEYYRDQLLTFKQK